MSQVSLSGPERPDKAARGSEEQFRLLVEQVQDYAIYLISPEGRVATWNAGAERIKGYTAAEIIGKPYATFFTEADRAAGKPDRLLQRAREEGRVEDEGWRVRKDGSRFWADAVLTALRDPEGRLQGYAKVTRDLTERRWGQEQEFLAEVSRQLSESLGVETTLRRIAQLAIPRLADWCAMDLVDARGKFGRVATAGVDSARAGLPNRAARDDRSDAEADDAVARVLRSGRPEFYPEIRAPSTGDRAEAEAHPAMLAGRDVGSAILVPLVARGATLGVLTLAFAAATGRRYTEADLALAEELGRRAAVAVDNARLYRDLQEHAAAQAALNTALREAVEARDRALAEAEAARRHLHELFMQAPAAIAITRGPDHVIELANPLALRVVNRRDPAELLGRPAREAFPEHAGSGPLALADRVYATGETFVGREVPARWDRDGDGDPDEGYFTFVVQPYRGLDGAVAGLLAHAVEVTEMVRARQRVEALVTERDAFLAAASHDLKSPLASIKATAQFLRRQLARTGGVAPDRLAAGLATIEETGGRMLGLVNELLDVARLRMGQTLDLDRKPTDLVALARRAAAAQQQLTDRHRIRVDSAVDELLGEWDAARLARVLGNLLDNAVKYSPKGGEIVVDLAAADGWAVLRVHDRGIGIPLGDRERIFEVFQRGSNVAGAIAGTGVGLAGVRQIVEQHGGTIGVESREGAGSTFTVRLPLDGREEER